ncbi:MAG: aminotransferase class IV [Rhodospirillaceae bacterium]
MTMIWFGDRLVPAPEALISPADRGFTLGDGVFETLCCRDGRVLQLEAHLERLNTGAKLLEIPLPLDFDRLKRACEATLAGNGLTDGSLRLTLTRGPGARGLPPPVKPSPTLVITAAPMAPPPAPARLIIAESTRRNEHSPLSRIKSLNALDNILARQEAIRAGADDAILLNTAGRVAETSIANLFAMIDGVTVTPPVEDGALPGIARRLILERLEAEERPLLPADLARAAALFLSNSLGLRPVSELWLDRVTAPVRYTGNLSLDSLSL